MIRRLSLRSTPAFLALLTALTGLSTPLEGQEGPVTFEFSFSNPGARSMALGGAFAALADDATAAFANPAGLVQLLEPELSVEGRAWSYDTPFVRGGRASGTPTGIGVDTAPNLLFGNSASDETGFSFGALVYPGKRWSLALYRHTWAQFDLRSEVNGLFGTVDGEDDRSEDVRARTRVEVINTGLAGAFELTERFSIGLGVVFFDAFMDSLSIEYAQSEEAFYEANPFTEALLDTTYSHQANNTGTIFHAGFLWRPSDRWSLGGFYREGPRMDLRVIETVGNVDDEKPPGTIELDKVTPLRLPDVFGLGIAYRTAGGAWTVSFEWARVGYSSITRDLDTAVFDPGQIRLDDGDELRLGMEHVFFRARPVVALRLGAWRDPAHSVGSGPDADLFERTIFQDGQDEIHLTGGLGLVFSRFQLDLAVDLSELADLFSLSVVYRF